MPSTSLAHPALGALLLTLHLSASADDALPGYLTGFWGTAATLSEGTAKQNHFHLRADGYGLFAGSSSPMIRTDGVNDGKPAPRAIVGFPFKAVLEGGTLIVHPFLPGGHAANLPAQAVITCSYLPQGPSLVCTVPDAKEPAMILSRQSGTLPAEIENLIAQARGSK